MLLKNELLIFAKYPEPGRVKMRLARTLGEVEAALRYRGMVETVMQKTRTQNGEYHRTLCFDPPHRKDDFRKWFPALELRPQSDGDLGKRMSVVLQNSLSKGLVRSVLIGTDCVEIDRPLLCDVFDRLEKADLVLGPAKDGGYYLIGMKKSYPFLFEGISWSTEKVLQKTLNKAKKINLKIELLKTLSDLDEES